MFCTECGHEVPTSAKFCAECGARASTSPAGGTGDPVEVVFGSDATAAEACKKAIIDSGDVGIMRRCAERALALGDDERADFWYLEWITAGQATPEQIAEGIYQYRVQLLEPQSRYAESELYLSYLAHSHDAVTAAVATSAMQDLHRTRGAKGMPRYHSTGEWKSVDVSLALDSSWPADLQYRRCIAWLDAKSHSDDEMRVIADRDNPLHLSYVTGMVLGMRGAIGRANADWEAAIQGLQDWIDYATAQRVAEVARQQNAEARQSHPPAPKPVRQAPAAAAPTENSLGNHIDRLFGAGKYADQIKRALGCSSGLNDDFVVAAIPVSAKLGDSTDYYDQYMVFTRSKVAIVKKSGMFSSGDTVVASMSQIALVGIGESDHYEAQGISGRSTAWVSVTVELTDGRSFTRHSYLGHNEREVNGNAPKIRKDLERMISAGWPVGDGPAWQSSGGYRTSYGYGIGVWR